MPETPVFEESKEELLTNGMIDAPVTLGATDTDMVAGAVSEQVPIGVYKVFNEIRYNQNLIDPYSCTFVSAITALSNSKNIAVPLENMQRWFLEFVKSGQFTPGFGARIDHGANWARLCFNEWAGTSIKMDVVELTMKNVISSLSAGFCPTTGLKYGPQYFKNEQDDGKIQNVDGTIGAKGHAVALIKANTLADQLIKWEESYDGLINFNEIHTDFVQMRDLFFNSMVRFYE